MVQPQPLTLTNHAGGWDPGEMALMFAEWNERRVIPLTPEDVAAAIADVIDAPDHVRFRLIDLA